MLEEGRKCQGNLPGWWQIFLDTCIENKGTSFHMDKIVYSVTWFTCSIPKFTDMFFGQGMSCVCWSIHPCLQCNIFGLCYIIHVYIYCKCQSSFAQKIIRFEMLQVSQVHPFLTSLNCSLKLVHIKLWCCAFQERWNLSKSTTVWWLHIQCFFPRHHLYQMQLSVTCSCFQKSRLQITCKVLLSL